jgi:hypothetical protein
MQQYLFQPDTLLRFETTKNTRTKKVKVVNTTRRFGYCMRQIVSNHQKEFRGNFAFCFFFVCFVCLLLRCPPMVIVIIVVAAVVASSFLLSSSLSLLSSLSLSGFFIFSPKDLSREDNL